MIEIVASLFVLVSSHQVVPIPMCDQTEDLIHEFNKPPADPFLAAAKAGDLATLKLLAGKGQDLNVRNQGKFSKGWTALMFATRNANEEVALWLVSAGGDVHAETGTGFQAIYLAVSSDYITLTKAILAKGVSVNLNMKEKGRQPIHGCKSLEMLKFLIEKGANIKAIDTDGRQPINTITDTECVRHLIGLGCDVNNVTFEGYTPLHEAAGNLETMKLMIEAGAKVNAFSKESKFTPLHSAVISGNASEVKLLLDHGADINAVMKRDKFTNLKAIHLAAEAGSVEIIKTLIKAGEKVDAVCEKCNEPITLSANYGKDEAVKLFISLGASKKSLDHALKLSCYENRISTIKILVSMGADIEKSEALKSACFSKNLESVKLLISLGSNVNASDENKYTPLFNAVRRSLKEPSKEIVKALLAAGADVNALNMHGVNCMYDAARSGNAEIVTILIAAGAKIDCAQQGYQPIHSAARGGHLEVIKVLVKHGASLTARTDSGATPYSLAKEEFPKVAEWILNQF